MEAGWASRTDNKFRNVGGKCKMILGEKCQRPYYTGILYYVGKVCLYLKSHRVLFKVGVRMCIQGFPGGSVVKNPPANAEAAGSIPGSGRSSGGGILASHSSFLPGESHGQRSLVGYRPQGHRVGHDLATKSTNNNNALSVYMLICQREGRRWLWVPHGAGTGWGWGQASVIRLQ